MAINCPLCDSPAASPCRGRDGLSLRACNGCGSRYLDSEIHTYRPVSTYDGDYFIPWDMRPGSPAWTQREATAAARLDLLVSLGASGRLLDLGCAGGYLVSAALVCGFDAFGMDISSHAMSVAESIAPGRIRQGVLEEQAFAPASFDVITAFDVVEHHPDPAALLRRVTEVLKPGGIFAATVPDLDSLTARLMRASWPHYKEEHRFYPTRPAFRRLLTRAGLGLVRETGARKRLSLAYLDPLLRAYPVPVLTRLSTLVCRALPRVFHEAQFTVTIGERLYVARLKA